MAVATQCRVQQVLLPLLLFSLIQSYNKHIPALLCANPVLGLEVVPRQIRHVPAPVRSLTGGETDQQTMKYMHVFNQNIWSTCTVLGIVQGLGIQYRNR